MAGMVHPILARGRLGLYLAGWLPVAGLLVLGIVAGTPSAWLVAPSLAVPLTAVDAFLCLAAWYPSRANPLGEGRIHRTVGIHLGAAVATTGLWIALGFGWARLLASFEPLSQAPAVFRRHLPLIATAGVLLYLLSTVLHYLLLTQETAHEARRRSLELQVAAREAELRALRSQMDPHFLFNALNSVSAMCGRDPGGARRMCERLGRFFRTNVEISGRELIPLGRELELVLGYLKIERVRFGDRLAYVHEADERATEVEVPPLVLQPLVENAVKHGIAHLVEGGTVRLRAILRRGTLYLTVENPCDPERPRSEGTELGLENVRRRLAAAYGDAALLRVDERPERFRIEIRIPAEEPADGGVEGPSTGTESGAP